MCLIALAVDAHPDYGLILAANRDEFYDRPTAPADFWAEAPEVLAGRDLRAGGTWLGVTRRGYIAAVTNYRDPAAIKPQAPSRGELVREFLAGKEGPEEFARRLPGRAIIHNGFNLVFGIGAHLSVYASRDRSLTVIPRGLHALSNRFLDTPWPKVVRVKAAVAEIVARAGALDGEGLFRALADKTPAGDADLPETGVGLDWERILSPIFIRSADYGTRSSTVILIDRQGRVTFMERSYNGHPQTPTTVQHTFQLEY